MVVGYGVLALWVVLNNKKEGVFMTLEERLQNVTNDTLVIINFFDTIYSAYPSNHLESLDVVLLSASVVDENYDKNAGTLWVKIK